MSGLRAAKDLRRRSSEQRAGGYAPQQSGDASDPICLDEDEELARVLYQSEMEAGGTFVPDTVDQEALAAELSMMDRGAVIPSRNNWGLGLGGSMNERLEESNRNSICGIMIESRKGMENLDEILEVPHIDFISFGLIDISADLGYPGEIRHPEVIQLVEKASQKVIKAGKARPGTIVLNQEDYLFWRGKGHQVICCVAQHIFVEAAQSFKEKMDRTEEMLKE